MKDVVRSGVFRALFAETIGANGAILGRCGTGNCCETLTAMRCDTGGGGRKLKVLELF